MWSLSIKRFRDTVLSFRISSCVIDFSVGLLAWNRLCLNRSKLLCKDISFFWNLHFRLKPTSFLTFHFKLKPPLNDCLVGHWLPTIFFTPVTSPYFRCPTFLFSQAFLVYVLMVFLMQLSCNYLGLLPVWLLSVSCCSPTFIGW